MIGTAYVDVVRDNTHPGVVTFAVYPNRRGFALYSGVSTLECLPAAFAAGLPIYLDGQLWGYGTHKRGAQ